MKKHAPLSLAALLAVLSFLIVALSFASAQSVDGCQTHLLITRCTADQGQTLSITLNVAADPSETTSALTWLMKTVDPKGEQFIDTKLFFAYVMQNSWAKRFMAEIKNRPQDKKALANIGNYWCFGEVASDNNGVIKLSCSTTAIVFPPPTPTATLVPTRTPIPVNGSVKPLTVTVQGFSVDQAKWISMNGEPKLLAHVSYSNTAKSTFTINVSRCGFENGKGQAVMSAKNGNLHDDLLKKYDQANGMPVAPGKVGGGWVIMAESSRDNLKSTRKIYCEIYSPKKQKIVLSIPPNNVKEIVSLLD